jgi:hypothetical protein
MPRNRLLLFLRVSEAPWETWVRVLLFDNLRALRNLVITLMLIAFIVIESFLFSHHSFPLTREETDGIYYMRRAAAGLIGDSNRNSVHQWDGIYYLWMEAGAVFQAHPFHGPGYPLAIWLLYRLGLDLFSSAKAVSLVFGVIFIMASWLILSSFSPPKEALLATIIIIFNSFTLTTGVTIMSDMMAAALFLLALALLLGPKEVTKWRFILAGIFGGLAYLTRYVFIITLVVPLIFWLFRPLDRNGRLKALPQLFAFLFGFLLITLPWFVVVYQTKGSPFWNQNYLNVAFKMLQSGQTITWNVFPSSAEYSGWFDVITSHPSLFFKSWLKTIFELPWQLVNLIPRLGVIGGLGFFFWLASFNQRKAVFLAVTILYGLFISLGWLEDRFLLLFIPLVASCIASGLFAIPNSITLSDFPKPLGSLTHAIPLRVVTISLAIILLVILSVRETPWYFYDQADEYKRTADWLEPLVSEDTSIMASKPHIAFFSQSDNLDFRAYHLQEAKIEDLPQILAEAKPTYFIYDERYGAVEFPQFRILLDPNSNPYPQLLSPVFEVDSPRKLIVYKYNF